MVRIDKNSFFYLLLPFFVLCALSQTGCFPSKFAFKSLEEVQENQSIIFGEVFYLFRHEDGTEEKAFAYGNKIRITLISRETSEFLYYDINTKEDIFYWNLPPGKYILAEAKVTGQFGIHRIFTQFQASAEKKLLYIGSLNLFPIGRSGRYRMELKNNKQDAFRKLKMKFPELEGEPTTDIMVFGDRL